jgi:Tfp pilus assembly protein PilF
VDELMRLAVQHQREGRLAEAEAIYRQLLAASPDEPAALHMSGVLALQRGELDQARALIERAIALCPDAADFHGNLGELHRRAGRLDLAIATLERALQLRAAYPAALFNLGLAHAARGEAARAADAYARVLALDPVPFSAAAAACNLASALKSLGRFDDAEAAYRKALAIQSDLAPAHWNWGLLLLLRGELQAGWVEFEWRRLIPELGQHPSFPLPQWDGHQASGKTLLIYAEQGLGDVIQFARFLPLVAERSASRVMLLCQPELCRLLAGVTGVSQVIAREPNDEISPPSLPAPADLYCPLLSLPLILGTKQQTLSETVPYLSASRADIEAFASLFPPCGRRLRVGLAWSGREDNPINHERSVSLHQLAPLAKVERVVEFYSLQKGPAAAQTKQAASALRCIDPADRLGDLADTAAFIAHLDLVITVDTAIAHLAAALGKPVWLMLSHVYHWPWGISSERTPWYPTMRLFRQKARGDWSGVVTRVEEALRELTESSSARGLP